MMVEKQKYQAYATATQTVSPVRQIVLLYDGRAAQ
jgi:flagellin-specific chaperone FliS